VYKAQMISEGVNFDPKIKASSSGRVKVHGFMVGKISRTFSSEAILSEYSFIIISRAISRISDIEASGCRTRKVLMSSAIYFVQVY
jgi:hypothetical protein